MFVFVFFLAKGILKKAAHKMLVKFTKSINFTNFLGTTLLYKSVLSNFAPLCMLYVLIFWRKIIGS